MSDWAKIVRSDGLVDGAEFLDDGCDVAELCLECPLEMCKYDFGSWRDNGRPASMAKDPLMRELVRQYDAEGMSNVAIAQELGIGARGVQRIRLENKKIDAALRAAGLLPEETECEVAADDPLARPIAHVRAPYPEIPGNAPGRRITTFAR